MESFVAIDLETTGVDASSDRILEVAAVRIGSDGTITDSYSSLVQPGIPIPEFVSQLTSITDDDVRTAPQFDDIRDTFVDFVGSDPIIGHNVQFDLNFLRASGVSFSNDVHDTWVLSTMLLPHMPTHSLEPLVRALSLPLGTAHRAESDATATAHLFHYLRQQILDLPDDLVAMIHHALGRYQHPLLGLLPDVQLLVDSTPSSMPTLTRTSHSPNVTATDLPDPSDSSRKHVVEMSAAAVEQHFHDIAANTSAPFDGFDLRESQVEMASLVSSALMHGEFRMIEAGTGLGKSFAYLLPALQYAVSSSEPVLVSTHTLHLQDQLLQKDIPVLEKALPFDVRASVLKGRRHYLCTRRFEEFLAQRHTNKHALTLLVKLLLWCRTTPDGDLSTLRPIRQEYPILQTLVATKYNCQGTRCKGSAEQPCFYKLARERAQKSNVVIVNHALLFTDALREGDTLAYSHLIVDEAHHLESALVSSLETRLSQRMFDDTTQQLRDAAQQLSTRFPQPSWQQFTEQITEFQNHIALLFGLATIAYRNIQRQSSSSDSTLTIDATFDALPEWKTFAASVVTLQQKMERLQSLLALLLDAEGEGGTGSSMTQDERRARARIGQLRDELRQFVDRLHEAIHAHEPSWVYWLEQRIRPTEEMYIHSAPVRVQERFEESLLSHLDSCVLTSATLRSGDSFEYLRSRLGLGELWEESVLASPYDYRSQVTVVLPTDITAPSSPKHASDVARILLASATAFDGRTLGLFTSHQAVRSVARELQRSAEGFTVLAQGVHGGKTKLLEQFRHTERAILLGTHSFWEGIDIVGDALSSVVIAKLPFPVPSDPLVQQQSSEYDNPFMEFMVPQALLKFQQGFGRLVRSADDQGVVIVADSRVQTARYGNLFLESLPTTALELLPLDQLDDFLSSVSPFSS